MNTSLVKHEVSKAVLITGCSSGIGKATALRLAQNRQQHGWTVWATARRKETLDELEAAGCNTLALDVTDETSMERAVRVVEATHGSVGVLINNAGYAQAGAVESVPMAQARRQFDTNFFGLVRLTQLVLPKMRAQGWGRIVNLSSMGGKLTFPGAGFYHATKYAVEAISDALRFEVRGFGIRVVLIEPGLIRSDFGEAMHDSMQFGAGDNDPYGEFHEAIAKATSEFYDKPFLARLIGTPDDVARVIEGAITRDNPRARYTVSGSARLFLTQRAWLSDRAWDAVMRSNFPSPAPKQTRETAAESGRSGAIQAGPELPES
jgi:NAD(P)-dependent dehydrogenase (short-subunit alcohol dehydrogenase family)